MSIATKPPVPSHVGLGSQKLADFNGSDPGPSPASVIGSNKSHPISSSKRVMRHRGDTSILNAGLSIVFILYSIFIIIIGIWGNSMLSKTCIDPDVRSNLRGLLISGSVSATAFISYSACKIICTSETVSDVIGENWFLALGFIVGMANFIMGVQLRNQIALKPECQDGSFTSFDQVLLFFNIFSAMVWIVILVIFGYRLFGHYKKLVVQEKQKRIINEVEMEKIEGDSKVKELEARDQELARRVRQEENRLQKEEQIETMSQAILNKAKKLEELERKSVINGPKKEERKEEQKDEVLSALEERQKVLDKETEATKKRLALKKAVAEREANKEKLEKEEQELEKTRKKDVLEILDFTRPDPLAFLS